MPRGVYQRNKGAASVAPSSFPQQQEAGPVTQVAPTETVAPIEAPKTQKMELKRHYVPHKLVSVVGYQRPERKVKNAAGEMVVVTPSEFINGEVFPPVYAGVGFANKIWAGTVIEVPEDEAKTMRQKGIAEVYL